MKNQEYINLKRHIKHDFNGAQADSILNLVDRIRELEALLYAERLWQDQTDIKIQILAKRVKDAGVDIDINHFLVTDDGDDEDDDYEGLPD